MAQSFPNISQTQTVKDSRQLLLDRDSASASNFSGTAFPTTNLMVGMKCHRTDLGKSYILKDASSQTWVEETDFSGTSGRSPQATKLATPRTFAVTSSDIETVTPASFDGTASHTIAATLKATGVAAGTYTKVTVDAKGRVTAATAITNTDLPADLARTTLRATSGTGLSLSSTAHGFGVGPDAGVNMAMDSNQIQARNNGATSPLYLNLLGGNIVMGDGATTAIKLDGAIVSTSVALATNAEALGRSSNTKLMTPLRSQQLIIDTFASTGEAQAGTATDKTMSPALVEAHMLVNALGWGQQWGDYSGSRTSDTTYQNFTGRPIMIVISADAGATGRFLQASTDGSTWANICGIPENGQEWVTVSAVIPNGHYYRVLGTCTFNGWGELR